jgi:hypothetical protein
MLSDDKSCNPREIQKTIDGHLSTMQWKILGDDGIRRQIQIANSYYVPAGTTRILSPQHWAKLADKQITCITSAEYVKLYNKTINFDPNGNNVGNMWSEPGYSIAYQLGYHATNNFPNYTSPHHLLATQLPNVNGNGMFNKESDQLPTKLPLQTLTDYSMSIPWLSIY